MSDIVQHYIFQTPLHLADDEGLGGLSDALAALPGVKHVATLSTETHVDENWQHLIDSHFYVTYEDADSIVDDLDALDGLSDASRAVRSARAEGRDSLPERILPHKPS